MLTKDRYSPLPRHWLSMDGPSPWWLAKTARRTIPVYPPIFPDPPTAGAVTAALKIYIALVAMADDDNQRKRVGRYAVKTTYEEIQQYLKLSRAMVREGLKLLEQCHAIERTGHKPLVYKITGLDRNTEEGAKGFVKLPKGHLYGNRRQSSTLPITLANYPTRGVDAMNGLALYLLLLSVVQRDNNVAMISYERIKERTDMSSKQIRQGLDLLVNHNLISVLRLNNEETFEAFGMPVPETILRGTPNAYLIKGLKGREYNQRVNTLDEMIKQRRDMVVPADFDEPA
tara:strand:+ start:2492 stop:3349 length:858 start_codon:yes stop_codon:yes gene_type:complete